MNTKKILMVDDDQSDIFLIKMLLDKGEFPLSFEANHDAEHALKELVEMADQGSDALPDLILLDINMPRMNGFEFQEQLARHSVLTMIPVIFMTTSDSQSDVQRAYEVGGNAYITKPGNLNGLKYTLERLCDFWCTSARLPSHRPRASMI